VTTLNAWKFTAWGIGYDMSVAILVLAVQLLPHAIRRDFRLSLECALGEFERFNE